jgi:hypothetical protein
VWKVHTETRNCVIEPRSLRPLYSCRKSQRVKQYRPSLPAFANAFPKQSGNCTAAPTDGRSHRPKVVSAKSSPISAIPAVNTFTLYHDYGIPLDMVSETYVEQSVSGSVQLSAAVQRRGSHCTCCSQLRVPATSRLQLLCNYATIPRSTSRMLRGSGNFMCIRADLNPLQ